MDRGFVKVWRKILDNQSWSRGAVHRGVMMTLFVKANWKKSYFHGYEVQAGEIALSVVSFAEELKIPRTTLQRILKDLQNDGLIIVENVGNQFTRISLQNWAKYQTTSENVGNERATSGQRTGNEWATSGQQVGTSKEYKNVRIKEGKNNNPQPPKGEEPACEVKTTRKNKRAQKEQELIEYVHTHILNDELQEAILGWMEARKENNKPVPTLRALKLNLNDLKDLAPNNEELQIKIVNQSTKKGYLAFFGLKEPTQQHKQTLHEAFDVVDQTFAELRANGINV